VRLPKDTSAEGNRYHNKRFVALGTEMGLRGPDRREKVIGWPDRRLTHETAAAYADVIVVIDSARLPFILDSALGTGGGEDGPGGGEDGEDGQGAEHRSLDPLPAFVGGADE
jgi:hypothetical protein